jgi:hypothetical protein
VTALEAMPFQADTASKQSHHHTQLDKDAFKWLWGLAQAYLLVPGSHVSLLNFFSRVAGFQNQPRTDPSPGILLFSEDTASPLRTAFGIYLEHLATTQSTELCSAFRLGLVYQPQVAGNQRLQNRRFNHPNVLHFGAWSRQLLPRLLRAAGPTSLSLRTELLQLSADVLANLVDDSLLLAFGADTAVVCERLAENPEVLLQWVTRKRLRTVPLVARRHLCISLVPHLGSLCRNVAAEVVLVMAGDVPEKTPRATKGRNFSKATMATLATCLVVLLLIVFHYSCLALELEV